MSSTKFKDLTIKNAFMFAAVMSDEELCRKVLERVLGFPIEKVHVCTEKTMVYHPEYHGIRLDVFAADKNNTRFNIEMQVRLQKFLPKRGRYYHSQMDMDALAAGISYEDLPDSYVIFICDFDPFGKGLYKYTSEPWCMEQGFSIEDGVHTIYLSTQGKNDSEVPKELVQFLKYIKGTGEEIIQDTLVKELQKKVEGIKKDRSMEEKYMLLEEMMKDERKQGRLEGKIDSIYILLTKKGTVTAELREKLAAEKNTEKLDQWIALAAQVKSVEEFAEKMQEWEQDSHEHV